MDLRLGPDIDATRRLVEDQELGLIGEPFAQHDLLLIAAGELARDLLERARLDRKALDAVTGELALGGAIDKAAERDFAERGETEILAHRHRPHQSLRAAIFRHIAYAERAGLRGGVDVDRPTADFDFAAFGACDAENRVRQFAAARADEAGEADDFAGAHGKADFPGEWSPLEILDLQHRFADRNHDLRKQAFDLAADHQLHQFGRRGVRDALGRDMRAVTQHGDAIGDRENLVEPVADIDHGDAARLQLAHDVEEPSHVVFGQRRGRLVHDQDAGVLRQCAQDFDALAIADAEGADDAIGLQVVNRERGQQIRRLLAHRAPVEPAEACARRMPHEDVLGDGELGKQQQLLIDRRDAGAPGVVRPLQIDRLAVDDDRAAIGRKHAGDDLDQGRFAGAVLAKQRVDLALRDVERDAGKRADAGKGLLDVAYREQGRRGAFAKGVITCHRVKPQR